jgi:hypothetical protein
MAMSFTPLAESSDFRYWGQGTRTDYGREICRRGAEVLANDFRTFN